MEDWKSIPGYEGIYEASNMGRIRSVDGKVTHNSRRGEVHWKQRIMKQKYVMRRNGRHKDARVTLWKDKKPHYYLVSRLIAMTWCDGYSDGMTVDHIDGNPENNRADNLEWVTLGTNIRRGFENGLYPSRSVEIEIDGKKTQFASLAAASRALGHNPKYLSNRLRKAAAND